MFDPLLLEWFLFFVVLVFIYVPQLNFVKIPTLGDKLCIFTQLQFDLKIDAMTTGMPMVD